MLNLREYRSRADRLADPGKDDDDAVVRRFMARWALPPPRPPAVAVGAVVAAVK